MLENEDLPRQAVIGDGGNAWRFSSRTGFDLTHSSGTSGVATGTPITIAATNTMVTVDPAKTALVVVDMQNFFLSAALGRDAGGAGHKALQQLVEHAIPAARQAGIRVVWVNWGLTQQEIDDMPPAIKRAFGFEAAVIHNGTSDTTEAAQQTLAVDRDGKPRQTDIYKGLGHDYGMVRDPATGAEIAAGKLLMRDQWISALHPPLDKLYEEGMKLATRPDVWIHKNRMSGLWGARTELEDFLEKERVKTLLFTGVNTDQCVGGTLQDAFSKGYDCILLSDGAGTTSPEYAQQCIEFNCARSWGFVTTCAQFAEGVNQSMRK